MKVIWSLSLLFLLTACMETSPYVVGNKAITDQTLIDQIIIGETTQQDVKNLFGNPQIMSEEIEKDQRSEVWTYSYSTIESAEINLFSPTDLTSQSDGLTIKFQENGTVSNVVKHHFGDLPSSPHEPMKMKHEVVK